MPSAQKVPGKQKSKERTQAEVFEAVPRVLVTNKIQFKEFFSLLRREDDYACDTEFNTFNEYSGECLIAGISFYLPTPNVAYYIPINHTDCAEQLSLAFLQKTLGAHFAEADKKKSIWHAFKADYRVLIQHGIDVKNAKFDTLLARKLINENSYENGLKELSLSKFEYDQIEFKALYAISKMTYGEDTPFSLNKSAVFTQAELRDMFGVKKENTLAQNWESVSEKIAHAKAAHVSATASITARIKKCEEANKPKTAERLRKEKRAIKSPLLPRLWKALTNKHSLEFANICEMPIRYVLPYATDDVICTYALKELFAPHLEKMELAEYHVNQQVPMAKVLGRMELRGAPINMKLVREEHKRTTELVESLEARISKLILKKFEKTYTTPKQYEKTGKVINLGSGPQLAKLFYEDMQLTPTKFTKKGGKPSTDVTSLTHYAEQHKIVKLYLQWKKEDKILHTYLDAFQKRAVKGKDGVYRIHCNFVQYGAKTGRLSCKNPNLQNQPQGPRIRQFFYAPPGWFMIVADYSQVELRILAYQSRDPQLVKAYCEPLPDGTYKDIHKVTSSLIFGVDYFAVTDKQRKVGKTINFGIIYGMGPNKLAEAVKSTLQEAQMFVKKYKKSFAGATTHFSKREAWVKLKGYAQTILGRRRHFPEIYSSRVKSDKQMVSRIIRQGLNSEIQGTSYDITEGAMVRMEDFAYDNSEFYMALQVHDEIGCLVREDVAEKWKKRLVKIMQSPFEKGKNPIAPIPLLAEAAIGSSWSECKG